ncbi:hypothetical protein HCN44_007690 [Aphidius gifuensis]|uniref:peptidylprolyl isomerase n=1 Tax=Aphidius gifuensis TaxID=684658 RepID=A0A834XJM4_APHGI|nr:peptidyl-prolyl cis-trans isomerase D [Aphidius gifuensis]KAF7988196.1 hypothetical protein HCN44_007690 [Aphidius gifuensis]
MKRPFDESSDTDNSTHNPIVYLDLELDGHRVGRVIIELFKNIVPKTAENFRSLCTGEKGIGKFGKKLHYKGSYFHRVVSKFMIQGGDIINFDGTGGESIYGSYFEDENFNIKHKEGGLLSMVNEGKPNTNSSQFIITTEPSYQLNDTNVVFGKVIKGFGAVQELNEVDVVNDKPIEKIQIVDCGELKPNDDWKIFEKDGTPDIYPNWLEDWDYYNDTDNDKIDHKFIITKVIEKIKESGNYYFSNKNYITAKRKYLKALRYYNWINKMTNIPDDLKPILSNLKMSIDLNLTAVYLKLNKYRDVIKICNNILSIDKNNTKALFRKSQANFGLNEYNLSLADLQKANLSSPNNPDVIREIQKVKNTIKSYLNVEKESYKRMFM